MLGRNLFSVLIAPLHSSFCSFTVHWERPDVLWCICWHNDLFHHTKREREKEELLHIYSFFPLAAFTKVAGNCPDLEAFPHMEYAVFSGWNETWCHKGHHLWAISTPWSKSCFCTESNLMPCCYNALQRRELSAHRYEQQRAVTHKNFNTGGFQD